MVLGEWGGSAHPQSPAAERAGMHVHSFPVALVTDWPPAHSAKSHARILILLSRKSYPNVRMGKLRCLF